MSLQNENIEKLKRIVDSLPDSPGVYQFLSKEKKVIYVGKARNIKKRVSSYFTGKADSGKTKVLVGRIADIEHIIVDSEQDALLLENNLIKEYKPKYNVLLKDDKSFPWICIKNEPFPRIFSTRNKTNDQSEYFGPYTSVRLVKIILDLFKQLFYIRSCNLSLTEKNINAGKFKVCLEYHLGNCKAPCVGIIDQKTYNQQLISIRKILKGNIGSVKEYMKEVMKQFSDSFQFELAEEIRQKLLLLNKYQSRSTIVSIKLNNIDVYSYYEKNEFIYVNFLKVVGGSIVQSHTVEIKRKLEESKVEILELALFDIRHNLASNSKEIILPFSISYFPGNVKLIVPKRGEKKMLLDLSSRNAINFSREMEQKRNSMKIRTHESRILSKMKSDFHLSELPDRIECFDNSNLQGSNAVASCVVFKNLKPAKKSYRHFNIKTVTGPDDFKSMKEIIKRRYERLLKEEDELPQLIVIDGGKGQLRAAYDTLKSIGLEKRIAVIGIAKRLEEIFFPNDPVPIYLDKNSESLKVIQNIRNEAHRFAISFHRTKRSSGFVKSELESIKGIGAKISQKLLVEFKSIENIKNANFDDLAELVGKKNAENIIEFFKHKQAE